ncbi:glycosyl hydrolase family 2 [Scopulibacillus darangshiensis]|uniref:Glycosyl hydrolase family 2 n=1 Tax=Scopulibacillus darangshiensis TaxID=442528 RepID=A0A4V6NQP0_9BACL|nr:PA14 domain-containing protein [Scopulibacillus darangshiensis]TCP29566.1 glycosyl hydrolase family 2 [Scopulibacillus darangshiensis]
MCHKKSLSIFMLIVLVVMQIIGGLPNRTIAEENGNDSEPMHGLKAEYYTSSADGAFDFDQLKKTVVDPNLDFADLNPTFKSLANQEDNVTVRWTGKIQPKYNEDYTFHMIGDNGFRLWVNGKLIIDHWVDDWEKEQTSQPISLEAGKKYSIKVEYFEHFGGANLHLSWSSASQPKEIVPWSAFYLPEDFHYAGPVSSEVNKNGDIVVLDFPKDLKPLPEDAADHFKLMGRSVPVKAATLKKGDPSTVILRLNYAVTKPTKNVRVIYDGESSITYKDGNELPYFNTFAVNHSTYIISSQWAKDVSKDHPLNEYPRPQMKRGQWMNLNGEWQFEAASEGDSVPTGKKLNGKILVPFPVESRLSGVEKDIDRMWYKRQFDIPKGWNGQQVLLHFGAVDWQATVFINGHEVGAHKGGYDSFTFDITKYLRKGNNELIVGVSDVTTEDHAIGKQRENPGGIFYTSVSGIWQTVWLEDVSKAHMSELKMKPDIHNNVLKLSVLGQNLDGKTVKATAYMNGKAVGTVSGKAGDEIKVPVPNAKLWSPSEPVLYDLKVKLKDGSKTVDKVSSYFGMREIKLGKVGGKIRPMVNGKFVFQMGPLDQGFWPAGIYTAPTDEALKFDILKTKQLGYNMIRKHVKIEPQRWYYWADKLGILVWQDMPSMFNANAEAEANKQFKTEMQQMVNEHFNHPSITQWTVFNEGWGQHDTKALTDMVEAMDPTRLVNNSSGYNVGTATDSGTGDVIDPHCYVGPCGPAPSSTRMAVVGEFGGLGLAIPGHMWATESGFSYDSQQDQKELTNNYVELIEKAKEFKADPGVSGAVYTQTTDVEGEHNGLLTYDRKVLKMDLKKVRKVNEELTDTTSISSIRYLVTRYQKYGQIKHGLAKQLINSLKQAQRHLDKGKKNLAIKSMKNFDKHLNKNNGISKTVQDVLNVDSNLLIEKW